MVPVRVLGKGDLIAHTPSAAEPNVWHALGSHLLETSRLATSFADAFGGGPVAGFAGLVHDAGKAALDVQCALRRCAVDGSRHLGVPHKGEGAQLAYLVEEAGDAEAATAIMLMNYGHHNGIPNLSGAGRDLRAEMKASPGRLDDLVETLGSLVGLSIRDAASQAVAPAFVKEAVNAQNCTSLEFFTRMCHSALVDADFLDTSRHFRGGGALEESPVVAMGVLAEVFFAEYERRYRGSPTTRMNALRRELFDDARRQGGDPTPSKIYRLPAGTGTGKTMAAAAFALEHARTHGKRRVLVAVPYTSITTQNAAEYRRMFGSFAGSVVLEHQSGILDSRIADDSWRRFAAGNWDAQFIVTTTVQLFDSLFSNKPSATRKLHRLADSVVVVDEVQALPRRWVPAILNVLRELSEHYGVTVLLSSATQPRFWARQEWKGLEYRDIEVPGSSPGRVVYQVRQQQQTWDEVADELAELCQALVIVNTTDDAQALYRAVRRKVDEARPVFHLSTRMCGQHRADTLEAVRRLLGQECPVILVSTQVVEAGVDVDFPVVYRAVAPADSILQSAGRCNREGVLRHPGRVVVFNPAEGHMPPGEYQMAASLAKALFVDAPEGSTLPRADLTSPKGIDRYYEALDSLDPNIAAGAAQTAARELSMARARLDFEEVATMFHMIDDDTVPVVVEYGSPADVAEARDILTSLHDDPGSGLTLAQRRFLGRFTVSLQRWMLQPGAAEQVGGSGSGSWRWIGEYDEVCGVVAGAGREASIW
ncbi:MAG: CRISPR-associated helicase Cas3' [Propionibacteriaceae bacterium]|nr:CRISPR-associated helicase Cas3' [Propionibacteriaceae bacterium]